MQHPTTLAVAANVRSLMALRGLTQHDVARHLGISQQAVSDRLRGETVWNVNELADVALLLDVTAASLLVDGGALRIPRQTTPLAS